MRDRFHAKEVWQRLGLPVDQCLAYMQGSESMRKYQSALFSRIVPTIKDIGLWGKKIQTAFAKMGILHLSQIDLDETTANDEQVANEFDARRQEITRIACDT